MTRRRLTGIAAGLAVVALVVWIARNTTWEPIEIPLPPSGEALTNPFYAAQRLAEQLGARTEWRHDLGSAAPDGVVVVSGLNWSLIVSRRTAIEQWVEDGGRLVVDSSVLMDEEFSRWSGITVERGAASGRRAGPGGREGPDCRMTRDDSGTSYRICGTPLRVVLKGGDVIWALHDERGAQVVRVRRGRGNVTAVNASPFTRMNLLDRQSDHARLLVAAAGLRRGDALYFLSENERPSLTMLIWRHGAPVVCLFVGWLALVLWRGAVRFGPPIPAQPPARRSLAEQIRGTARFALRVGGGESLYEATLHAFTGAATKRIPGFAALDNGGRARAAATITGVDERALASALRIADFSHVGDIRAAVAVLEIARRQLMTRRKGPLHGS
jgi:hypothetical protein